MTTPLGLPVEPLVYITTARSDGRGSTIALATVEQRKALPSCTVPEIGQKAQPEWVRNTHHSPAACPSLVRTACCGWKALLGSLLCSFSCHPHKSHASGWGSVAVQSMQKKQRVKNVTGGCPSTRFPSINNIFKKVIVLWDFLCNRKPVNASLKKKCFNKSILCSLFHPWSCGQKHYSGLSKL